MAVPGSASPTTVVFDIGNVLIRWDPRHLYRRLFTDERAMEWFLANVCSPAWNLEQDRGRSFAEAVALLVDRHPEHEAAIRAYDERWPEMVPGPIEANVAVLSDLQARGVPTYAITNFSREKLALSIARFPFLASFTGTVVSAHEGLLKPDPAIFRLFLDRYGQRAERCVFIDDSAANVAAAREEGMQVVHYQDGTDLAAELARLGIPTG